MVSPLRPVDLRTERLADPLGLDDESPRLSWKLAADPGLRGLQQAAWRVKVETETGDPLWEPAWSEGPEQEAAYAGTSLRSRQRCIWRVQVRDGEGRSSAWSEPAPAPAGTGEARYRVGSGRSSFIAE
jgi:alpha-L-rhamnosidase